MGWRGCSAYFEFSGLSVSLCVSLRTCLHASDRNCLALVLKKLEANSEMICCPYRNLLLDPSWVEFYGFQSPWISKESQGIVLRNLEAT